MNNYEEHGEEILDKSTGVLINGDSMFLVVQFTKSGLPVFLANKNRTSLTFTKHIEDSLRVYSIDHAEELMKKLKFGHLKVVTLTEAVALEAAGAPEPVNFDTFEGLRMKEY